MCISFRLSPQKFQDSKDIQNNKKMSSDGGDIDEPTIYGYLPGSFEPYVSFSGSNYQQIDSFNWFCVH